MIWFAMLLGCLDASAEPPVQWEYARVQVYSPNCLLVEQKPTDPLVMPGSACLVDSVGATIKTNNVAGALDLMGLQGWELVATMGTDFYFKRRK